MSTLIMGSPHIISTHPPTGEADQVPSTVPPPRSRVFSPEAGTEPVTARIEAAATLVGLLVGELVEEPEDGGDRVGDSFPNVSER